MNKGKPQIITSSVSENYGENRNKGSTIKTHKHLYEKIISLENIQLAITKASRGKLKRASVQRVLKDRELYAKKVQDKLMGKDLKLLEPTTKKTRLENGKARELAISPFYPNQIIHHALANIIEPLLLKTLSTQTCACIKGRGVDYGLKRVKRYAKVYRYYLKCDIAKFYAHINLAILHKQIARNISCARTLALIAKVLGAKEFARIFSYYGYMQRASCFNLFSKILRVIKHKIKAYCKKAHIAYPLKGLCFYRREPRLLA